MDTPDNNEKTPDSEVKDVLGDESGVNDEFMEGSQGSESFVKEARPEYNKKYTYTDYLTWDDDVRRELIDGVPYMMAGPNSQHQKISRNLFRQFDRFLEDKPCEIYYAPFDVRLNADTLDDTVVQPDLIVVCDESKIEDAGCVGAPDLVVEILSPSTSNYDKTTKYDAYQKAGIREFWVIDPVKKTLAVHLLEDGIYITRVYTKDDTVGVHVLEGCKINLAEVFKE